MKEFRPALGPHSNKNSAGINEVVTQAKPFSQNSQHDDSLSDDAEILLSVLNT